MQFTATQIAMMINGQLEGDAQVTVSSFGKIEEAVDGQISFLANPKYEDYLYCTKASVIIVNQQLILKQPIQNTLIRVPDAYSAFATLLTRYQQMMTLQMKGIQEPSYIHSSAKLGEDIFVGAFAYIDEGVETGAHVKIFPGAIIGKDVKLGHNTIIHAGVKIYHGCVIGNNVIIHAGAVIGSDGFGFAPQGNGSFQKVPQIGNVIIEDEVEIGANTTIDRATMGSTIIRMGAKLDNLVQIAHNVEIGCNTVIAAQTGVSGSTKIGKSVMIGGQTGIAGHITIADGSKINGQSGITKSIKEANRTLTGTPADDFTRTLRAQAHLRKLPDLEKRVKELEKIIEQLLAERVNAS